MRGRPRVGLHGRRIDAWRGADVGARLRWSVVEGEGGASDSGVRACAVQMPRGEWRRAALAALERVSRRGPDAGLAPAQRVSCVSLSERAETRARERWTVRFISKTDAYERPKSHNDDKPKLIHDRPSRVSSCIAHAPGAARRPSLALLWTRTCDPGARRGLRAARPARGAGARYIHTHTRRQRTI